jgi:hypothetical protein
VVRNTLVTSAQTDGVSLLLSQMLQARLVTRAEPGASTPIVVLLGSDRLFVQ